MIYEKGMWGLEWVIIHPNVELKRGQGNWDKATGKWTSQSFKER